MTHLLHHPFKATLHHLGGLLLKLVGVFIRLQPGFFGFLDSVLLPNLVSRQLVMGLGQEILDDLLPFGQVLDLIFQLGRVLKNLS